jgi:hypothetical protein
MHQIRLPVGIRRLRADERQRSGQGNEQFLHRSIRVQQFIRRCLDGAGVRLFNGNEAEPSPKE